MKPQMGQRQSVNQYLCTQEIFPMCTCIYWSYTLFPLASFYHALLVPVHNNYALKITAHHNTSPCTAGVLVHGTLALQ